MSYPKTYQAFRRSTGTIPTTLELSTEEIPSLTPQDVLIRIHAISLNYRDVFMMHGKYPMEIIEQGIPTSDCAAEVVAIGSAVHDFKIGDHVAPIFDLKNLDGTEDETGALGGDFDGVLRQFAVFDQNVLYHLPEHLSWEEAACVTCAGVTAWNALDMPRLKGTALLQGTGGVSMFGLLICLAAGIHPIITSSSDRKLDLAKANGAPGAIDTINYKTHPQWAEEALRITNGRGVNVIVDNVGATAIAQSLSALARRGTVSLVGFLGGFDMDTFPDTILPTLKKGATIRHVTIQER
ncbi:alcohol dehydrogenase [Sclerotinia borealis F-4128]|uniref:Alcohol dehydrogenase n=1 Tax=Sclerotinia borealis (strain F-4128) TaxID=1432307 RepID=W9C4Y0_SCLBF|nr:alcohol dehydrogenase [Sclerotinia borealis F-4128]